MSGKKFRFSLQSVLKLRTHEAEQAQRAAEQAARARQQQQAEVQRLREQLDTLGASAAANGNLDPLAYRRLDAHRQQVQQEYAAAQRRLEQAQQEEARQRDQLVATYRAKETLEILKEKERVQHHQALDAAERDFLDEQAVTGFARRLRLATAP